APLAVAQRASALPTDVPLFTSVFNYRHNTAAGPDRTGGFDGVRRVFSRERSNYPLTVSVDDDGTGFRIVVDAVGPIDPAEVAGMLHTAATYLVAALEDDGAQEPLSAIGVLDSTALDRLLVQWNDTAVEVPGLTVPELFALQVSKTPDAAAVRYEGRSMSYADLDAASTRVAQDLVGRGVGPESVVALRLPRGFDMV